MEHPPTEQLYWGNDAGHDALRKVGCAAERLQGWKARCDVFRFSEDPLGFELKRTHHREFVPDDLTAPFSRVGFPAEREHVTQPEGSWRELDRHLFCPAQWLRLGISARRGFEWNPSTASKKVYLLSF